VKIQIALIAMSKSKLLNSFLPLEIQLEDAAKKDLKYILQKKKDSEKLSSDFYKIYNKFVKSNPDITDIIQVNNVDATGQFPGIARDLISVAKEIVVDNDGFVFDFSWDESDFDLHDRNHMSNLLVCFSNTFKVFEKLHQKNQFFTVQVEDRNVTVDWGFGQGFMYYD
jgi:hypothetical protein